MLRVRERGKGGWVVDRVMLAACTIPRTINTLNCLQVGRCEERCSVDAAIGGTPGEEVTLRSAAEFCQVTAKLPGTAILS
jgi:ferredoxin